MSRKRSGLIKARVALAALFCACGALKGCASAPVETAQPSINPPAVDYCRRNPESVLCM